MVAVQKSLKTAGLTDSETRNCERRKLKFLDLFKTAKRGQKFAFQQFFLPHVKKYIQ